MEIEEIILLKRLLILLNLFEKKSVDGHLPKGFHDSKTVYRFYRRAEDKGIWARIDLESTIKTRLRKIKSLLTNTLILDTNNAKNKYA